MPSNASAATTGALVNHSSWQIHRRVISALLMRELLTRYGRSNIGFLWLFVEPTIFILIITVFRGVIRGAYPGLPLAAFALTGYPSMLLWRNSVSRTIGALKSNTALLYHRQVTIMDVYTARILLELAAVTATVAALVIACWSIGWLAFPEDLLQVLFGWFLLAWLAAGLGLTIGAISEKVDVVKRLWSPISYILGVNSGAFFIVDVFPPKVRELMLWVPMLDGVEYMRDGWFGSVFTAHYSLSYLVICDIILSIVGLTLVRQLRFNSADDE